MAGCVATVAALVAVASDRLPAGSVALAAQTSPAASWVDRAAHNFGGPINTKWDEGEFAFADDGTMVLTSSRQDKAVAPGDPKDLYIATFNEKTGTWNEPVNMGLPVNAAPATDVDPLRKGDDREPWITPDGNTIYFKSDRLATSNPKNANDIFVTHKVNGRWSTPELVPAPISTTARTFGSASSFLSALINWTLISGSNALCTSGRLSATVALPSASTCDSTFFVMIVPVAA